MSKEDQAESDEMNVSSFEDMIKMNHYYMKRSPCFRGIDINVRVSRAATAIGAWLLSSILMTMVIMFMGFLMGGVLSPFESSIDDYLLICRLVFIFSSAISAILVGILYPPFKKESALHEMAVDWAGKDIEKMSDKSDTAKIVDDVLVEHGLISSDGLDEIQSKRGNRYLSEAIEHRRSIFQNFYAPKEKPTTKKED